jgi:hypothetical protein
MNNSLAGGFVGSVIVVGRRGCRVRVGGAILVGHRGRRALVQEGPPLVLPAGVHPVCVWRWLWFFAASASPVSELTLKSGVAIVVVAPCWFRLSVSLRCTR